MFFIREKDIPIDIYEGFKDKQVESIAWEPSSSRFAALCSDSTLSRSIFFFKAEKANIKESGIIERKNVSNLFWAPKGRFLVLASLKNYQGELEFFDVDEMQVMATGDHFHADSIEWDPTGRYLTSTCSFWKTQGENGFVVWDFRGQMLLKRTAVKFKRFAWRPRPPTLLSKEKLKFIRKNLKEYSVRFEAEDSKKSDVKSEVAEKFRARILQEWKEWREMCLKKYIGEKEERAVIRGSPQDPIYSDVEEEDEDFVDELTEEVIEEKIEIIA